MKRFERKVLINYIYSAFYHVFSIAVPLVLTPYLSRVLGAIEVGRYAYEYSVSSYFALFVMLGTKNYGSKIIAYNRDDEKQMNESFWNIYSMQLCMLLLSSIFYCFYVINFAHTKEIALPLYLIILAGGIDITWFFWGLEDFKTTVIRDTVIKLITTLLVLFCVKSKADTWKYALIVSVGMLVSQLILWIKFFGGYKFVKPQLKKVVKHIKPNLMMFIPIAAVNVYKTMDKVMLEIMSNSEEVGYYYSSEKIINVPLALVTSLNAVMLPRMSYLRGKKEDTIDIVLKSMIFSVGITTLISVCIISAAKQFVPVFYGSGYDKCIVLFYILLPTCCIIAFTNVICSQYLIPNDRTDVYAGARVVGAIINLFANAFFIPILQSYGAALGTLLTEIAVCCVQLVYIKRQLPIIKMMEMYLAFLVSGVIALGIMSEVNIPEYNLWISMVFKAGLGLIIYSTIVIIWGSIYKRRMNLKYEKRD